MIRRRATLLLGVVGLALLGAAAARVIYTSSGAGIVTLLIIGAVLLPRYLTTQVECPAVRMWQTSSFFVAVVRRGQKGRILRPEPVALRDGDCYGPVTQVAVMP